LSASQLGSALVLAGRMLVRDPGRLATAVGGVAFAVLLMLVQMGFRHSLLDSAGAMVAALDGEIFVLHREKEYSLARDSIRLPRLYQSMAAPGVATAYPVWVALGFWKNLENGVQRPVRIIGVRPEDPVFRLPEIRSQAAALARPDTALLDSRSRAYFGRRTPGPAQVERESLDVIGTFAMATDLDADGNIVVSDETFRRVSGEGTDSIEMAVVTTVPGARAADVKAALRSVLPGDVAVYTRDEIEALDRDYWDTGTPVSVVVLIGMIMGLLVGIVICYQILFTEVTDNLAEFATLRAMGYGPAYLITVVLAEALLLPLVALVPSLAAGAALYAGLASATGMLLALTWPRAAFVSVVTVGMCAAAGLVALRKVFEADPAELFR
jgi:putative ABC transport system permease protein